MYSVPLEVINSICVILSQLNVVRSASSVILESSTIKTLAVGTRVDAALVTAAAGTRVNAVLDADKEARVDAALIWIVVPSWLEQETLALDVSCGSYSEDFQ